MILPPATGDRDIDEGVEARAGSAFTAALSGRPPPSRPELGEVLRAAGISPDGQRLPHLLMGAELDGLIASGPRHGKQFTYALLEERAPKARALDRADAVAELTRRYFRSHGPAQVQDFARRVWPTESRRREGELCSCDAALEHQVIEGKDYWFDAAVGQASKATTVAHLLSNFDEYTVAYRDRAAAIHPDRPFATDFFSFGILSNVVTVGGRVRGAWRRTVERGGVKVQVRLLDRLASAEVSALEDAGHRLGRFLERPVELIWP